MSYGQEVHVTLMVLEVELEEQVVVEWTISWSKMTMHLVGRPCVCCRPAMCLPKSDLPTISTVTAGWPAPLPLLHQTFLCLPSLSSPPSSLIRALSSSPLFDLFEWRARDRAYGEHAKGLESEARGEAIAWCLFVPTSRSFYRAWRLQLCFWGALANLFGLPCSSLSLSWHVLCALAVELYEPFWCPLVPTGIRNVCMVVFVKSREHHTITRRRSTRFIYIHNLGDFSAECLSFVWYCRYSAKQLLSSLPSFSKDVVKQVCKMIPLDPLLWIVEFWWWAASSGLGLLDSFYKRRWRASLLIDSLSFGPIHTHTVHTDTLQMYKLLSSCNQWNIAMSKPTGLYDLQLP